MWEPVAPATDFQTIATLEPHTPAIRFWDWGVPLDAGNDACVLVVVSGDDDAVSRSDANPDDRVVDFVTPNDKHVAHRNFQVISPMQVKSAHKDYPALLIALHNPGPDPEFFDVDVEYTTLTR